MSRKFNPDPDYGCTSRSADSTNNFNQFGERGLYIVKYDEDFQYTEASLSPKFLREYSIGSSLEVEPLKSPRGTQAFLLEQWGSYYLLLAYEHEAVFMMRVDDLDDTDRILNIASRSYLALRKLNSHPQDHQLLLDFDKVDIWGNETTDQWAFHSIGESSQANSPRVDQGYIIGICDAAGSPTKEGKFVDIPDGAGSSFW